MLLGSLPPLSSPVPHHVPSRPSPPQVLAELQLIAIMLRSQFGPATVDEENQAVELQVCILCTQKNCLRFT